MCSKINLAVTSRWTEGTEWRPDPSTKSHTGREGGKGRDARVQGDSRLLAWLLGEDMMIFAKNDSIGIVVWRPRDKDGKLLTLFYER